MSVRIAILGASGAVGSTLAVHILRSGLLEPQDCLMLVGHGAHSIERRLMPVRVDLLDAFDDERVQISIVPDIDEFEADIVVVAAGETKSSENATRRDLAVVNLSIFRQIAQECAARLPRALFIVVSNPVELAVQVLTEVVDRQRVIGMGSQQDSLRFARAVATDLDVSRRHVRASVFGEHGLHMVPLWQTVELLIDSPRHQASLARLSAKAMEIPLMTRVTELMGEVEQRLAAGRLADDYATCRALPDARIVVQPTITAQSMHSTPNATANATLQLIIAALTADKRRVHGQVKLAGEALGIDGVCGRRLWDTECLDDFGRAAVASSADAIGFFLNRVLLAPESSRDWLCAEQRDDAPGAVLVNDFGGGPRPWKLAWVINFQKVGTFPFLGFLIAWYHNTSTSAWIYLAMHGSYGLVWIIKDLAFPDPNWQNRVTIGGGINAFLGVLGWYWVFGWLLIAGVSQPTYPLPDYAWFCLCISLCILGCVIMIAADGQKYFTLRLQRGLITDGLYRYIRHPNYLGEMMIYGSFALMVWHWIPVVVLAWVWGGVFAVNMRLKEASMSRYPEWAQYKQRSWWLLPLVL
jgi:protein-S-isoprenylcysteine O-methyltransferase Ste14